MIFVIFSFQNVLAKYEYSQIPNWAYDEQSFNLVIGDGPNATKIYMETNLVNIYFK